MPVITRRPVGLIPRPSLRANEVSEAIWRAQDRLRNPEIASGATPPRNDV